MMFIFMVPGQFNSIHAYSEGKHQHHRLGIWNSVGFTKAASNDLSNIFMCYTFECRGRSLIFSKNHRSNEAIYLWASRQWREWYFVHLNESPHSISVHWISHGNNILIFLSSSRRESNQEHLEMWKMLISRQEPRATTTDEMRANSQLNATHRMINKRLMIIFAAQTISRDAVYEIKDTRLSRTFFAFLLKS